MCNATIRGAERANERFQNIIKSAMGRTSRCRLMAWEIENRRGSGALKCSSFSTTKWWYLNVLGCRTRSVLRCAFIQQSTQFFFRVSLFRIKRDFMRSNSRISSEITNKSRIEKNIGTIKNNWKKRNAYKSTKHRCWCRHARTTTK